jgi:2-polyprenyl-3-methyl-5-hydroxy-6-metoxy-1,4-benzoquinol methylase
MSPVLRNFIAFGSPKTGYYKEILMRAHPMLHGEALAALNRHLAPPAKVIDVGAGQGAFSLRLRDAGYDVLAVDTNRPDFRAKGVSFRDVDFNVESQVKSLLDNESHKYDLVVGMEVIEHVENPWSYLQTLKSLARNDGLIILTTPNIESAISKLQFMLEGTHAHFTLGDYHGSGHINPLTYFEIELIAAHYNLKVVESGTFCRIPKFTVSRNVKYMFYCLANVLLGCFMGPRRNGDILYFILKNGK